MAFCEAGRTVVTCGSLKEVAALVVVVDTAEETDGLPGGLVTSDFRGAGLGSGAVKFSPHLLRKHLSTSF